MTQTNKQLKTLALLAGFATLTFSAQAQTKIGGAVGAADPSAYLQLGDASGANKGLLLSRVSLTNTGTWGLAGATPVEGMQVYNTNAAVAGSYAEGVGIYYWDGTNWIKVKGNNTNIFVYGGPVSTTPSLSCSSSTNANTIFADTVSSLSGGVPNPNFGKQWLCNGTTWIAYTAPPATEWYLSNTNSDAGGNKANPIYRAGSIEIRNGLYSTLYLNSNAATAASEVAFGSEGQSKWFFGHSGKARTTPGIVPGGMYFYSVAASTPTFVMDTMGRTSIGQGVFNPVNNRTLTIKSFNNYGGPGGLLVNNSGIANTGSLVFGTANEDGFEVGGLGGTTYAALQSTSSGNLNLSKKLGFTNNQFVACFVANTPVGNISTDGTNLFFNNFSDKRLKENIQPTHFGLSDLLKIQVADYNYKSDTSKKRTTGFLAQDLYKVYPNAVSPGGDDEKTNPWSVDYSKLTPLLVKAIQDQQVMIQQQQTQIEAMQKELAELKK